jgi:hypothetical protein
VPWAQAPSEASAASVAATRASALFNRFLPCSNGLVTAVF